MQKLANYLYKMHKKAVKTVFWIFKGKAFKINTYCGHVYNSLTSFLYFAVTKSKHFCGVFCPSWGFKGTLKMCV